MKNNLCIFSIVFATILLLFPQKLEGQEGYEPGKVQIDLGIGFSRFTTSSSFWWGANYNPYGTPVFRANIEYGFHDYISGGVYFGFHRHGYRYNEFGAIWEQHNTRTSVGGRVSFHWLNFLAQEVDLDLEIPQLDVYSSLMLGMNFHNRRNIEPNFRSSNLNVGANFGLTLGARYAINDKFGVFVETGRGSLGWGIIGASMRF